MPRKQIALLSVLVAVATPATAWAFGGGIGCTNLPEYERAVGALEGMPGACDMTVEQARRIVAQHDGTAVAPTASAEPAAPRVRYRHYRRHHRLRRHREM